MNKSEHIAMPPTVVSYTLLDYRRVYKRHPGVHAAAYCCEVVCMLTVIGFLTGVAYLVGRTVF